MRCYYCSSTSLLKESIISNFRLIRCNECGLLQTAFSHKYDSFKFNKNYYNEQYLSNYLNRETELKERFEMRLKEIESMKKGGNCLDIGCSVGLFLEVIRDRSKYRWNLYGLEINSKSLRIARNRIKAKFYQKPLYQENLPHNYFDCVSCFDVLEHDKKIKRNLRKIRKILKSDGLLVIQAPNYRSVMAKLCGKYWDWWSLPDHVLHFDMKQICKLLKTEGFIVSDKRTWESREDFIMNISGSIRKNLTKYLFINKIIARLSRHPLSALWKVLSVVEKKFDIGGLLLVYAKRGN